jgi:hypothetical protein
MTPTHCEQCARPLKWYRLGVWPADDNAVEETLDCADCDCGWQYTVLPDGTVQAGTWPDGAPTGEAA